MFQLGLSENGDPQTPWFIISFPLTWVLFGYPNSDRPMCWLMFIDASLEQISRS